MKKVQRRTFSLRSRQCFYFPSIYLFIFVIFFFIFLNKIILAFVKAALIQSWLKKKKDEKNRDFASFIWVFMKMVQHTSDRTFLTNQQPEGRSSICYIYGSMDRQKHGFRPTVNHLYKAQPRTVCDSNRDSWWNTRNYMENKDLYFLQFWNLPVVIQTGRKAKPFIWVKCVFTMLFNS